MDDRTARLESTVEQLRLAMLSLQRRIEVLEAARPGATAAEADALAAGAAGVRPGVPSAGFSLRDQRDPIVILSLIGRLILVIEIGRA